MAKSDFEEFNSLDGSGKFEVLNTLTNGQLEGIINMKTLAGQGVYAISQHVYTKWNYLFKDFVSWSDWYDAVEAYYKISCSRKAAFEKQSYELSNELCKNGMGY